MGLLSRTAGHNCPPADVDRRRDTTPYVGQPVVASLQCTNQIASQARDMSFNHEAGPARLMRLLISLSARAYSKKNLCQFIPFFLRSKCASQTILVCTWRASMCIRMPVQCLPTCLWSRVHRACVLCVFQNKVFCTEWVSLKKKRGVYQDKIGYALEESLLLIVHNCSVVRAGRSSDSEDPQDGESTDNDKRRKRSEQKWRRKEERKARKERKGGQRGSEPQNLPSPPPE